MPPSAMKGAIIVGASSGIGRALAVTLSREGYRVGVVARGTDLLAQLQAELTGPVVIRTADVSEPELAMPILRALMTNWPMLNSSSSVPESGSRM